MQKVVTISVHSIGYENEPEKRKCNEYPDLDNYLEEGYEILHTYQNENSKTITFLLQKD